MVPLARFTAALNVTVMDSRHITEQLPVMFAKTPVFVPDATSVPPDKGSPFHKDHDVLW